VCCIADGGETPLLDAALPPRVSLRFVQPAARGMLMLNLFVKLHFTSLTGAHHPARTDLET
jgi:hypothetical protein